MGCRLLVAKGFDKSFERAKAMPFINEVVAHNQQKLAEQVSMLPLNEKKKPVSQFQFDPEEVVDFLKSRIVGQDAVIDFLYRQLKVIKAGLATPGRPLLVTLFIGDTGVGKTEMVRLLAESIWGSADSFCRIDMNTLSQGHYSAAITGAPPGYVGSKEGVTLFNEQDIQGSYSRPGIVLFDEIEKADTDVVRSLMNIFDRGELLLASGNKRIAFTNSLVFMTSNLGSAPSSMHPREDTRPWYQRLLSLGGTNKSKPESSIDRALIDRALHQHFDTEFLNRIDHIAIFEPLTPQAMGMIVTLEIVRLNRVLQTRGAKCVLDESALNLLVQTGFDPVFGARALKRVFRVQVIEPLADCLLSHSEPETTDIVFNGTVVQKNIVFSAAASTDNDSYPPKPNTSLTPKEMTP